MGFQDRTGYGLAFEVQESCKAKGTPIDCSFQKDEVTGELTQLGPYERGNMAANGDIAGVGVLASFLIPFILFTAVSFIELAIACFRSGDPAIEFAPDPHTNEFPSRDLMVERRRAQVSKRVALKSFYLAIADGASFLSLAYGISFMLSGKCDMPLYHFYIGLDSVLFACSIMVTACLVTNRHNNYFTSWASILRGLVTLGIMVCFGVLIAYLSKTGQQLPDWWPPLNRHSSALVIPASCFLDPDLIAFENPYAPDQLPNAGELLGTRLNVLPEMIVYFFLCAAYVFSLIIPLIYPRLRYGHNIAPENQFNKQSHTPAYSSKKRVRGVILFSVFHVICIAASATCAAHILHLRAWVHGSGWMGEDDLSDEQTVSGIGQLLPLIAMGAIILVSIDNIPLRSKDREDPPYNTQPVHQRLIHTNGQPGGMHGP